MGRARGRRLIISLIGFVVLVFFSTPAALSAALRQIPVLRYLEFSQYIPSDTEFGSFVKQLIFPIWIILLNSVLTFLINYAAYQEKHRSFTSCQMSIFTKALFYLLMNMLIIPALTIVPVGKKANNLHFTSLFSLFKALLWEGQSIAQILEQFYFSGAGNFFIIVLLQSGAFGSSSGLLRVGEILNSFGSTWLAYYQRTVMNDFEGWRKKESDIFGYGYLSAQLVTVYAIVITYSVGTPGILLAGLSYFIMRNFVDGFNLLTVFKKEIDSGGHMIDSILKYVTGSCLLHQLALSISFGHSGYAVSCILTSILFIITAYLSYEISKPISTEEEEPTVISDETPASSQEISKWEAAYRHPLLVSPGDVGSKGPRTISYIDSFHGQSVQQLADHASVSKSSVFPAEQNV